MGGYGSGRSSSRVTTGYYLSVDIRGLAHHGDLTPGKMFSLSWTRNGAAVGSIGGEAGEDSVVFSWRRRERSSYAWQCVRQEVKLERTTCNYGGSRAWFTCPHCGRRVGVLYVAFSLACRKCLRLVYQSQRETAHGRACDRYWTLARKLDKDERRPKGMHRRTYERILAGMERANGVMLGEARRLQERAERRRG